MAPRKIYINCGTVLAHSTFQPQAAAVRQSGKRPGCVSDSWGLVELMVTWYDCDDVLLGCYGNYTGQNGNWFIL